MRQTYRFPEYAYRQSAAQREGRVLRHPVVIVGAGPVGLTAALDCAARGLAVLLLDDNNSVSQGSRAVCYAKRSLEVWQRLGLGALLAERGVRWQVGKVFFGEQLAYRFDLLPESRHRMPAMINLQQYHLEEALVEACQRQPAAIDLRWKHKLVALDRLDDGAGLRLTVETPDGRFALEADWLLACDGAGSDTRRLLGLDFEGQVFHDRFLIADVRMKKAPARAAERWFWFDPPFHRGQSVLLHQQCDGVWRIDFQLGPDADPAEEKQAERVIPRLRAMLGPDAEFELEWVSVYQFACRRLRSFRQGRVLFAGDSAHQVSPFGARGANSGVQDADNLVWKLAAVLAGRADERLLDSYHAERAAAADENMAHSRRATDFISPKSRASLRLRNAVLALARSEPFARPLVNSGRLSTASHYGASPLNTPDEPGSDFAAGAPRPGSPCPDAPLLAADGETWLLDQLGRGFTLLSFGPLPGQDLAPALIVGRDIEDHEGLMVQRYDGRPGTLYLIRPDQHVAARWRDGFDAAKVAAALRRALALQ